MSINLDASLQARMDGIERTPVIEIISSQFIQDIPFEGQYMNDLQTNEGNTSLSVDTQDRIIGTMIRGGQLIYVYSDAERLQLYETNLGTITGLTDANVCPMSDDNIAIVYARSYDIYRLIVDSEGNSISGATRIYDFTNSNWTSTPYAILLQDDSYLMTAVYRNTTDSNYYLVTWSSENFVSWTYNGPITLSGLNSALRKNYPTLAQASNGDIILAFDNVDSELEDGSQIINIYTITSTDNGSTWSAPVKQTSYNTYGTIGYHPDLSAAPDGSVTLAYTEKKNVLLVDGDSTNFVHSPYGYCSGPLDGAEVQFDPANNKLYVLCIYIYVGTKVLCSIVVIDVPTWTIDRCYTTETVPAYHPIFAENHVWWNRWISTGDHTCAGIVGGKVFMVVHHDTNEIVTYVINDDIPAQLLTANISIDFGGYTGTAGLEAGWLDSSSGRLYLYFQNTYYYTHAMWLGYINIHQQPSPTGQYSYVPIISADRLLSEASLRGFHYMHVVPEMDWIILGFERAASNWRGHCIIYQISTGGIIKHYNWDDYQGFPQPGIQYPIYYNGHIYGGTPYQSTFNHQDRRGLMDINLATDEITYITPSFATADNYGLNRKKLLTNGRILMDSNYGPCIYDTVNGTWELFSNTLLPGLPTNDFMSFDYDPLTGTIFAGAPYYPTSSPNFRGVAAWNEQGDFRQSYYMEGEKTTTWNFDEANQLTRNWFDYENSITIDPEGSIWTMWTRRDRTEYSIKWDKEGVSLALKDFLVRGQSVQIEWHVDGINRLSFKLSHGHLFDPLNTMSVLSTFVQKGRRISVYIGEVINSVEYMVNQGEFLVMATSIQYKRGDYPTIDVSCEDYRTMWSENHIVATPYYGDLYPETVVQNLLTDLGRLELEDISIPTMSHRHLIYCQFLDDTLDNILKEILDHFQCFSLVGPDGVFEVREINLNATPSHEYTDLDQIIHVVPDDEFSSFVNRVVVKGEGRYDIEVLYEYEPVGNLSGTTGWWGKKIKEKVWYSEDHERTCRDPELEILQSIKDFRIFGLKGGGDEYISSVDISEQWVEITIEAPNLVAVVISLIAAILINGKMATACVRCGPYIFIQSLLTSALGQALGAVASYNYNIHARPIGHEKQTLQSEANDLELQRYLNGNINTSEIDDQFCYTVAECQRIANYELAIVQAQRKRLEVEKIGHLQDQVGDIIRVIHPYSKTSLKMFITDLTRSYTVPEKGSGNQGGLIDRLTGWRLISG